MLYNIYILLRSEAMICEKDPSIDISDCDKYRHEPPISELKQLFLPALEQMTPQLFKYNLSRRGKKRSKCISYNFKG